MGLFSFTQELAMDLGTANTIITCNDKMVVDEPSVIALDARSEKVLAVGRQAREMYEKTNPNIRTIRPLREGVIADFYAAEQMMRGLIKMASGRKRWFAPSLRMVIGIPSGSTEVEIRAVRDMEKDSLAVTLPQPKAGERGALEYVLDKLDIEADNDSIETQWVTAKREDGREDVELKDIPIREGLVPNVIGMGAKDAVYLLESVGLRASLNGMGRVSSQSVSPGSRVSKGQTVSLTLK